MQTYPTSRLQIFQSFEEMEECRLKKAASMDALTGLAQTVELILRVYGVSREELKGRIRDNKITITRFG